MNFFKNVEKPNLNVKKKLQKIDAFCKIIQKTKQSPKSMY